MNPQQSSSESGAAAIEFAVSAIVLFVLVFGCIGFATAFYINEVVNQYARDASRYAIVHGNGCTAATTDTSCSIGTGAPANLLLKTWLNDEIYPGINGNKLVVSTTYAAGPGEASCTITNCNGSGDQVTVTVSYPYLYNIPFVPSRAITLSGSSTMVISQ